MKPQVEAVLGIMRPDKARRAGNECSLHPVESSRDVVGTGAMS